MLYNSSVHSSNLFEIIAINITKIFLYFTYIIIKVFIRVLTELFRMKAATMIKLLTMPKIATAANTTDVTFQIESGKSGFVKYIISTLSAIYVFTRLIVIDVSNILISNCSLFSVHCSQCTLNNTLKN